MSLALGIGLGLDYGGNLFSPAQLFGLSEPGAWYDPSDLSTMFQDTAGTTPVTAAGQAVARINDKSGRGNHATQSVLAARPLYQVDAGGRGYLSFDGTDDFLVTPTITPNTDKVQVFAGVRKLSDAAAGIVAELSVQSGTNAGAFLLAAPATAAANYGWLTRGSTLIATLVSSSLFPAPRSAVLTGIGDIAGDVAIMRENGVQIATSPGDQGAGNFLAYPLYIGRRAGTSLPFNGHLYGLVVRFGANLNAGTISSTERWLATKSGVTI